jgi:chromosome segregation ATPase
MTKVFVAAATAIALVGGSQVPTTEAGSALVSIGNEIRLLRVSIEKASSDQVQIQAISVYLANEQARLVQLDNRLDAIRRDLDIAATESSQAAAQVSSMQTLLATNKVPQEERSQYEAQLAVEKRSAESKAQKESQLRLRETEALQELQNDRDQYNALVARLQQFIK